MKLRWIVGAIIGVIGLSLTTVPVVFGHRLSEIPGRLAVRSAQLRFLSLHGLSRSLAMEREIHVAFIADPRAQTVTLREGCNGAGRVVESRDFNLSYRVEMLTSGGPLELCMTPRGYADPGRNSFSDQGRVTFLRGPHAASVLLFPLGQATPP